ncbi:hypothetical protein [Halosimplex sp. J119]
MEERLSELIREILEGIESELVREQIRTVAFNTSSALPKRQQRPTVKIEFVTEQLASALGATREEIDRLHKFTLVKQEYYDIADDLLDGDVEGRREPEVYLTNECLLIVLIERLSALGEQAAEYWSRNAETLIEAPFTELLADPEFEPYLDILDKQARLYGLVTGLSAIVAGEPDRKGAFEDLGRTYYRYEQLLLDLHQYERTDSEVWNAWTLTDEERVLSLIKDYEWELRDGLRTLPDDRYELLLPLVAADVEAMVASTVGES